MPCMKNHGGKYADMYLNAIGNNNKIKE